MGEVGLILAVSALLSNLVAFVRDAYIVATYQSRDADMFFLAFTVPTILTAILTTSYATVFLPVFSAIKGSGRRTAEFVGSNVLSLALASVILIGFISVGRSVFGRAFGYTGQDAALLSNLTVLLLVTTLLNALGQVFANGLNSENRYISTAVAPMANNLATLAAIMFLTPVIGLYGLAYAFVFGSAIFFLCHVVAYVKAGYRISFRHWDPEMKHIGILFAPLVMSALIGQFSQLFDRWAASDMAEGSITALSLAVKMINLPIAVLVLSAIRVFFPLLCDYQRGNRIDMVIHESRKVLVQILFWIVPIMAGLWLLAPLIVQVVFERGKFTPDLTRATAGILRVYSLGLPLMAMRETLTKNFYAAYNTKVPTIVSVVTAALHVVIVLMSLKRLGIYSLPTGFVIAHLFNVACLITMLRNRSEIFNSDALAEFSKIALSTGLMLIVAWAGTALFVGTQFSPTAALAAVVTVAGGCYMSATALLRVAGHPVLKLLQNGR